MICAELNQSLLRGGQRLPIVRVKRLLAQCSRALGLKDKCIISIGFVSEGEMRRLNKTWRGKNGVTDVLSFELNEYPLKGEVLINYEQARRQARDKGRSIRDELFLLIVHGALHVFGYDHERPKDAKKMLRLQEEILRRSGIQMIYD